MSSRRRRPRSGGCFSSRSTGMLAVALGIVGCLGDIHLSASNLEIAPNPAVAGDAVVASFLLQLLPVQRHTIIVTIDDQEHLRFTSTQTPPIPYVVPLGAAADLISAYGEGVHTARVEVRAEEDNESTRTQAAAFELRQAIPPEEP